MKTKRPVCPVCSREIFGPSAFCPHCGGNQEELTAHFLKIAEQQRLEQAHEAKRKADEAAKQAAKAVEPPIATLPQSNPLDKKSKRSAVPLLVVGVVVIGVGAVILGTNSPQSQSSIESSETPDPVTVSFSEIQNQPATRDSALLNCDALATAIEVPDFLPRRPETIFAELENVRTRSAATNYARDNQSWLRDSILSQFDLYLRNITDPSLRLLIVESGYDSDGFTVDFEAWSKDYSALAISECNLGESLSGTQDGIREFQKEVDRVNALAD